MRVLVVGASGAVGVPLVRQLVGAGHEVVGTYKSPAHAGRVTEAGGSAVQLDLLDAAAVRKAVGEAKPDAIVHEATALSDIKLSRSLDKAFLTTIRLRTQGTDALLAAAREHGVGRFVAQSFATGRYAREGGWVKDEESPLDPNPPKGARAAAAAMNYLDDAVVKAGGLALRYGGFYGAANDGFMPYVKKGQIPIIGSGDGHVSFIHLEDAAAATVLAVEKGRAGVYHVVDDEPAPQREWLPAMAKALNAPAPRRIPKWLVRLLAGPAVVTMMTEWRGATNEKAKRELGMKLKYPSWRKGFVEAYEPFRA